ncbi:hypothetical protein [Nafulsella turpanensis]|uniref:hypothetical protein n=1 Tax=Nafulsella turpanensis TaxID=1265690 RepID=UPI0003788691|nr:hypothetical protein [Nafulsella turpanensis]
MDRYLMNKDFKFVKNSLLAACIESQQSMMQTAQQAMRDIQERALEGRSNEELSDAFIAQCQNEQNMYVKRLHEVSGTISILEKVKGVKGGEAIGFGSLIITNHQNFFVAASIGEFKLEDENFFIISAQTPIYKAMEGKRAGEQFEFRGRQYKIMDVV